MGTLPSEVQTEREMKRVIVRGLRQRIRDLEPGPSVRRFALRAVDKGLPPGRVVRIVQWEYQRHIYLMAEHGDLICIACVVHDALQCGIPHEFLQTCIRKAMNKAYGHLVRP